MSLYDPAFRELQELKTEMTGLQISDEIKTRIERIEKLMKERYEFCSDYTSPCSTNVEMLVKETMNHPWDKLFQENKTKFNMRTSMLCGNVTGRLLQFLVSCAKAKSVLEIGTFTGGSSLMMAEVLPSDGTVTTCDFDPYVSEMARRLLDQTPQGNKIKMILGNAKDTLQDLAQKGQKFDFIFIDADKKRYVDYFQICLDSLLADGGTMAVDNALYYGTAYTETPRQQYGDHTRKFNEAVKQRNDIYHVLLPVRDGIMLIRRKIDMDRL